MLEDCKETIIIPLIGTSGLKIEVSGLEIMNDDPGKHICLDVFQLALCPDQSAIQNIRKHFLFQLKLMLFTPKLNPLPLLLMAMKMYYKK